MISNSISLSFSKKNSNFSQFFSFNYIIYYIFFLLTYLTYLLIFPLPLHDLCSVSRIRFVSSHFLWEGESKKKKKGKKRKSFVIGSSLAREKDQVLIKLEGFRAAKGYR